MSVRTRPATTDDAHALMGILNAIIGRGGTTAHQTTFDIARITRHYIAPPELVSCIVAEENSEILGFQSLLWPDDEGDAFPRNWAIIASFVSPDAARWGVGRALFSATCDAAKTAGVVTIDATIRADNPIGLSYYDSLGFKDYDVLRAVPLRDGNRVDRIRKRFDL